MEKVIEEVADNAVAHRKARLELRPPRPDQAPGKQKKKVKLDKEGRKILVAKRRVGEKQGPGEKMKGKKELRKRKDEKEGGKEDTEPSRVMPIFHQRN